MISNKFTVTLLAGIVLATVGLSAANESSFNVGHDGENIKATVNQQGGLAYTADQAKAVSDIALRVQEAASEFLFRITSPEFTNIVLSRAQRKSILTQKMTNVFAESCSVFKAAKVTDDQIVGLQEGISFVAKLMSAKLIGTNGQQEYTYENSKFSSDEFDHYSRGLIRIVFNGLKQGQSLAPESIMINGASLREIVWDYNGLFKSKGLGHMIVFLQASLKEFSDRLGRCVQV